MIHAATLLSTKAVWRSCDNSSQQRAQRYFRPPLVQADKKLVPAGPEQRLQILGEKRVLTFPPEVSILSMVRIHFFNRKFNEAAES
jgi:hypothetical protein